MLRVRSTAMPGSVKYACSSVAGWLLLHLKSCFLSMATAQQNCRGHSGFAGLEIYYRPNLNRFAESRSRSIVERGAKILGLVRCWGAGWRDVGGWVCARAKSRVEMKKWQARLCI